MLNATPVVFVLWLTLSETISVNVRVLVVHDKFGSLCLLIIKQLFIGGVLRYCSGFTLEEFGCCLISARQVAVQ